MRWKAIVRYGQFTKNFQGFTVDQVRRKAEIFMKWMALRHPSMNIRGRVRKMRGI